MKSSNIQEEGEEAEGDYEVEDEPMDIVVEEPPEEVKPIMYRWVSSLKAVPSSFSPGNDVEMGITFSVPEAFVPPPPPPAVNRAELIELEKLRAARGPGICAVEGCGRLRKYRLPRDWTIGACDSTHLKIVANQA
jgi:Ino eighty subunit 2